MQVDIQSRVSRHHSNVNMEFANYCTGLLELLGVIVIATV
jgi:hypothetical protein